MRKLYNYCMTQPPNPGPEENPEGNPGPPSFDKPQGNPGGHPQPPHGQPPHQPPFNPGGQPPYQPPFNPGGQPHYQPPMPAPGSSNAVTMLVLGILGIICCSPLGIVAFFLAKGAKDEAKRMNMPVDGKVQAAYILGIISMVFLVIGVLFFGASILFGDVETDTSYEPSEFGY